MLSAQSYSPNGRIRLYGFLSFNLSNLRNLRIELLFLGLNRILDQIVWHRTYQAGTLLTRVMRTTSEIARKLRITRAKC